MRFTAKARYIPISPYKLRPIASAIRGKNVNHVLALLATTPLKKIVPLKKMIGSAAANAKHLKNLDSIRLTVKELRIDQGPIHKYFKPGAQGRANPQRRRYSHMCVILEEINQKEA